LVSPEVLRKHVLDLYIVGSIVIMNMSCHLRIFTRMLVWKPSEVRSVDI